MSKFLTPPVWYDSNGNLVEILTGEVAALPSITFTNSMAIGKRSVVTGSYSIAIGEGAHTYEDNTIAIGYQSQSPAQGSIAIGSNTVAYSSATGAIGSIAIGNGSKVYGNGSIAIGSGIQIGSDVQDLDYTIQIGSSNKTYSAQIGDGKGLLRCRSLEVAPISYEIGTYIDPVKNPVTISYPDKLILEKNGIYGFVFLVNGGRQTIPIVFNGTKSDAVKTYFNLSYGDTSDDYTIVYGSVVWGETDIKLRCSPFTAKDGTFIKIYLSYIVYFGSYQDS